MTSQMEPVMRFANKVCIVTGGSSGIGRATSERLAAEGGAVVVVGLDPEHGNETVQAITSKGGQEALTRVLALECEQRKVRVNCVAPGAVDTPMLWNNPNVKSGKEKVEGAVGKPEDIAAAICFLASDEARFINGTTLVVDGGR